MIADNFTNPLHGNLFPMFREIIMGRKHILTVGHLINELTEECVGNTEMQKPIKRQKISILGLSSIRREAC